MLVLDDENKEFKDNLELRALRSSKKFIYQKLVKLSRGENRKFYQGIQQFVHRRSWNWKPDLTEKVSTDLRRTMILSVRSFGSQGNWPSNWDTTHVSTSEVNVWLSGNAKYLVANRGELDNEEEFRGKGTGKPWATFVCPTVKSEYPTGHRMEIFNIQ